MLPVAVSEDAVYMRSAALRLPMYPRRRRNRRHGAVVSAVSVERSAVTAVDDEAGVDGVLDGQLLGRRDRTPRLDHRRRRVRCRLATVAADDAAATRRPLRHNRCDLISFCSLHLSTFQLNPCRRRRQYVRRYAEAYSGLDQTPQD